MKTYQPGDEPKILPIINGSMVRYCREFIDNEDGTAEAICCCLGKDGLPFAIGTGDDIQIATYVVQGAGFAIEVDPARYPLAKYESYSPEQYRSILRDAIGEDAASQIAL